MALCSQAFTKRGCPSSSEVPNPSKRACMRPVLANHKRSVDSSSPDDDSDDENMCYQLHQLKAKRRASTRISFSLQNKNSQLSKAIAQYSDDDEALADEVESGVPKNSSARDHLDNSSSCRDNDDFRIIQIPNSDKVSRSKCFDYLIGAIDEAWARYCDATTTVEDKVYGDGQDDVMSVSGQTIRSVGTPNTMASDEDYYSFDNTTDLTDLSDLEISSKPVHRAAVSKTDPASCQYAELKDRLTKAKYYLQDLVDSDNYQDVQDFWNRWDMIKYATIELVEDDDDDEVIESTIDDLEQGRYFVN